MITVITPGPLATIQDLGRPGLAHLGIGRSGAADRVSHRRANALVGNVEDAATVEMTLGRLRVRFESRTTIALTGAACVLKLDGLIIPNEAPVTVAAGQELRVGPPSSGLRTYLAIARGIDVPPVLGSRATDMLSGLGPPKLAAGDHLAVGAAIRDDDNPNRKYGPGAGQGARLAAGPPPDPRSPLTIIAGPRSDWFTDDAQQTLCTATWTVSADTNRVGARLTGPALERSVRRELPPEPMVVGALQVPPKGQPILFLADHPVTGGYPVIGVVIEADLPRAAQLRPGQPVHFRRAVTSWC